MNSINLDELFNGAKKRLTKKKRFSIYVSEDIFDELRGICKKRGVLVSGVLEGLMRLFIKAAKAAPKTKGESTHHPQDSV